MVPIYQATVCLYTPTTDDCGQDWTLHNRPLTDIQHLAENTEVPELPQAGKSALAFSVASPSLPVCIYTPRLHHLHFSSSDGNNFGFYLFYFLTSSCCWFVVPSWHLTRNTALDIESITDKSAKCLSTAKDKTYLNRIISGGEKKKNLFFYLNFTVSISVVLNRFTILLDVFKRYRIKVCTWATWAAEIIVLKPDFLFVTVWCRSTQITFETLHGFRYIPVLMECVRFSLFLLPTTVDFFIAVAEGGIELLSGKMLICQSAWLD